QFGPRPRDIGGKAGMGRRGAHVFDLAGHLTATRAWIFPSRLALLRRGIVFSISARSYGRPSMGSANHGPRRTCRETRHNDGAEKRADGEKQEAKEDGHHTQVSA